MNMSTTTSSTVDATSDNMDSWKPYLHTSLFSAFADRTPATVNHSFSPHFAFILAQRSSLPVSSLSVLRSSNGIFLSCSIQR